MQWLNYNECGYPLKILDNSGHQINTIRLVRVLILKANFVMKKQLLIITLIVGLTLGQDVSIVSITHEPKEVDVTDHEAIITCAPILMSSKN